MDDLQIIKLVFGIMLSVSGVVLLLLSYKIGYKYMIHEKRCTKRTTGTVYRYSMAGNDSFHLPVVRYEVMDKSYKVAGPEFGRVVTVTKSSPWSNNRSNYEIDEKKQILRINRTTNSMTSVYKNPMAEMYPTGSVVTVFYDPEKPKLAYVERYCNKKWEFWLMFLCGIGLLAMDVAILALL